MTTRQKIWKTIKWIWFLGWGAAMAIAIALANLAQPETEPHTVGVILIPVTLFGLLGIPFLVWCGRLGSRVGDDLANSAHVPSPQEIVVRFRQETGRDPTIEEKAALQQMHANQRNQALLQAGMLFGGAELIKHNLNKHR